jgi:uroporphyrinogen decarboxylase
MNDYDYPLPERMEGVETPEDLKKIGLLDVTRPPMGKQLKVIELVARELKGKALFVDTLFNAWYSLKRYLVKDAMARLMDEHPKAVLAALEVVNANLIQYAQASLDRGASGIFLSVPATAETLTLEQYERFMRPFDLEFLKAIQGKGECHILHAHGEKLYFDSLLDYPVHALSWADLNGGPTIAEARRKTSVTLLAGIDHVHLTNMSVKLVKSQVNTAIAQGGKSRFILAPGCAIPSWTFTPLIEAIRDTLHTRNT